MDLIRDKNFNKDWNEVQHQLGFKPLRSHLTIKMSIDPWEGVIEKEFSLSAE